MTQEKADKLCTINGVACFLIVCILWLFAGCTHLGFKSAKVDYRIQEESRALTTAEVDTLSLAPTNQFVNLALDLARHDQQLEGLPTQRIDVNALLSGSKAEWEALRDRYEEQRALIQKNADLENKLQAMGKELEKERNANIVKRAWHWLTVGIGLGTIGGIIALCIFCPVCIPIFTQIIAWIVSKVPGLCSALGVVSKKAFDAVVHGIEDQGSPAVKQAVNEASKENGVADLIHALRPKKKI